MGLPGPAHLGQGRRRQDRRLRLRQPGGPATTITYPGNKIVTRGFDEAGRMTTVGDWLTNQGCAEVRAVGL